MRLADAQEIIREVHGKSYSWLREWGLGTIKEAIRTIENRVSATDADRELTADVKREVWAGDYGYR